jgi:uncharacterized membrane protein YGL010W
MADKLAVLFADYAEHHRSGGNVACHMIGIPMIAFGLVGLLAIELFRVSGLPVEISLLLILALAPAYMRLDARLGAAITIAYLLFYAAARMLPWQANLGLFVLGWVFQFIGHGVYEKRSPAFFTNLVHLVVGPLWVANHLLHVRPEGPAEAKS